MDGPPSGRVGLGSQCRQGLTPLSPTQLGPSRDAGTLLGGLEQLWQDGQSVGGNRGVWGARRSAGNSMRNSQAKRNWRVGPEEAALTRKHKFPQNIHF